MVFVIVGQTPGKRDLLRSSRSYVQDAVRIASDMRNAGTENVMITDLRDGLPRPAWWLDALAEERA